MAARLIRVVPISPLADLRPLLRTAMNAELRLDPAEAAAESPALKRELRTVETAVLVGAEERPVFLDQARWLDEAWPDARSPCSTEFRAVESAGSAAAFAAPMNAISSTRLA